MKQINLRDFYPDYYTEDFFTEVSEEVLETLLASDRSEHAEYVKRWRYKAHYSLEANMGAICRGVYSPSAEEEYERKMDREQLQAEIQEAIDMLPESQARHIRYRFFGGKTFQEVADIEGTYRANIRRSNQRAIRKLRKILQNTGRVDYK